MLRACRRAQAFDIARGEFLQSYYLAPSGEARVPMLHDDPPHFNDKRTDALIGGIAGRHCERSEAIQVWQLGDSWIASLRSR